MTSMPDRRSLDTNVLAKALAAGNIATAALDAA